MNNILIYSVIRDRGFFIDKYYEQLKNIVNKFPQYNFYLSIYENDSIDTTKEKLLSKDWSIFKDSCIVSEDLGTKAFGSVQNEQRIINLSNARNKAVFECGFLDICDYVMMIEGDVEFDMNAIEMLLNFKEEDPNLDIVSTVSLFINHLGYETLWDSWATRYKKDGRIVNNLVDGYVHKKYHRYYSTSNGVCLYKAEPFKKGAKHSWISPATNDFDCEMVVLCEYFHQLGHDNIYILHNAKAFHRG